MRSGIIQYDITSVDHKHSAGGKQQGGAWIDRQKRRAGENVLVRRGRRSRPICTDVRKSASLVPPTIRTLPSWRSTALCTCATVELQITLLLKRIWTRDRTVRCRPTNPSSIPPRIPPTISTRPSFKRVAVWSRRRSSIANIEVNARASRSKTPVCSTLVTKTLPL